MTYLVTHAAANVPKSPIGIDADLDLKTALALACQLISQGRSEVTITDGSGKQISGEELAACCRGEKTLTADLRAVLRSELMELGDIGRLESAVNSVRDLERQLPYTVECACGEKMTTQAMEPVVCQKCGTHHRFSQRSH
jgi:hypothetical protein